MTALLLLIGAPLTLWLVVFPELERRGFDTEQAYYIALSIIGMSLIGAVLAGTAFTIDTARASAIPVFTAWVGATSAGHVWVAFVAVASVIGALTAGHYMIPDRVSRRLWFGTVSIGAIAMLGAFCWTHFSTAVESPAVAILVKVGHMTGAALWVGGLAVLAALPAIVPRDSDGDIVALVLSVVRRFSMIAVAGVTIAVVTGIIIAAWHVPTLAALVTTPYGILLSVKVGLVVVAAAMGGFNRFILHERIAYSVRESTDTAVLPGLLTVSDPQVTATDTVSTVARSVQLELAVLIVIVGLSVALTAMTPSYEMLGPAVVASSTILRGVAFVGFAAVLKLGAIGIAIIGSLALGYELGKFGVSR